jgi:hypothetical protein
MNGRSATVDQAGDGEKGLKQKVTANREHYKEVFIHATSPTSMAPDIFDVRVRRKQIVCVHNKPLL